MMSYENRPSAALVVGHPGHELRLFHWLEQNRPLVFVLTDGSGSGHSRIAAATRIFTSTGCTAGSVMGAFTDHEIYRAMLQCDVARVADATLRIAQELAEKRVTAVVADKFEFYNPTHDLSAVVANIATAHAAETLGRSIARYDFAVVDAPPADGDGLDLDDVALERKLAAANAIDELKSEVEHLIATVGISALRREVLRPLATGSALPRPTGKPLYEVYGEQKVALGRYDTVLRYENHFLPFVQKLIEEVGVATSSSALHAWS